MKNERHTGPKSRRHWESRPLRRVLIRAQRLVFYVLARAWRTALFRTTRIGITGSVGKSTCKEFLSAMLSSRFPTAKTAFNQNDYNGVPRTLLRVRPWHRYAVIEMGNALPDMAARSARLVRPRMGVFLSVVGAHIEAFGGSLEAIARDKARLVTTLPRDGQAVVNRDDPLVREAVAGCRARVVWFGSDAGADLQVADVSADWPERLSFTISEGTETARICTRLVGAHWVPSVAGAIATARLCGLSLAECAAVAATIPPFLGRMQPVRHPSGAVLLRDEGNGTMETLEVALEIMAKARAGRRILLFSGLSHYHLNSRLRFRLVGEMAARSVDAAIFVNKNFAKQAARAAEEGGVPRDRIWCFSGLGEASEWLKNILQPGDLLVVKGRGTHHLTRVVYDQFGPVGCWKKQCRKTILCDVCPELRPSCVPEWI